MPIRLTMPDDITHLTMMHRKSFPVGWSEDSFQELFSYSYNDGYVFDDCGVVKGCIIFRIIEKDAEILTLFVDSDYRRKKIGSKLLEYAVDLLYRHGVTKVHLEVPADNNSAIRLYEKYLFDRIGIRKGYYYRRGEGRVDAITMAKNLSLPS